ncbi:Yos1-like protein [Atractiella rhizophila]|nr:Yos1-like protein [Atractiella rhizophila]
MSLAIGSLFYVILLLINAVAVLSEERFLARIGWSSNPAAHRQEFSYDPNGDPTGPGIKLRIIQLIGAVRTLMRIPLILINIFVIAHALVLG